MSDPTSLHGLTSAQARVRIAQDVIECLDAEKITPAHVYCAVKSPSIAESFRDVLRRATQCRVCALGACFLAVVARGFNPKTRRGQFNPDEAYPDGGVRDALGDYFGLADLSAIEQAYESFTDKGFHSWRDKYPADGVRMRLIMENIVKHEGTFRPGVLP